MIPGRTIFYTEEVFTDWFPRGGDNIIMRAQAIDRSDTGTGQLKVLIELWSKNREDTGDGSAISDGGGTITLDLGDTSIDIQTKIFQSAATAATPNTGLYELVRYKIKTTGGAAGKWVAMRLFPPIFFDAGK